MTLLRLILEAVKAPSWLANREAGGAGALVGISWLPLVFGPWFTARIRARSQTTWALLKRLLQVLVVYGWASRIPVVVVTLLALGFGWDTHFNNFGPKTATMGLLVKIGVTSGAQLIYWSVIWTPIVGGLSGLMYHLITRKNQSGLADATDRTLRAT